MNLIFHRSDDRLRSKEDFQDCQSNKSDPCTKERSESIGSERSLISERSSCSASRLGSSERSTRREITPVREERFQDNFVKISAGDSSQHQVTNPISYFLEYSPACPKLLVETIGTIQDILITKSSNFGGDR